MEMKNNVDLTEGGGIVLNLQVIDLPEWADQNRHEFARMRREFAIKLLDAIDMCRNPVTVEIVERRCSNHDTTYPSQTISLRANLYPVIYHRQVLEQFSPPTSVFYPENVSLKERIKFLFRGKP